MGSQNGCLHGKVAIITGGGTGLGRAMALALAGEGADVVIAARREGPLQETREELKALGVKALSIATDVTNSKQVNQLIEKALQEMNRVDILINNAGIVRNQQRTPIWDITDEEWHLGIETNLTGAFYCCRAIGKHFVTQRSGKVINVASGNGLRGARDDYMYGCAKGGIIQLTRVLSQSWALDNIQVNCIVPGFIDTDAIKPGGAINSVNSRFIPAGRVGVPQDIGSLGLFLACDASDYITGGIFAADGGGLAGGVAPTGYSPTIALKENQNVCERI